MKFTSRGGLILENQREMASPAPISSFDTQTNNANANICIRTGGL